MTVRANRFARAQRTPVLMEIPHIVRSTVGEPVASTISTLTVASSRAPGGPTGWWTDEARQAFPDAIGHDWDWAKLAKRALYRVTDSQCACLQVEHDRDIHGCILLRWDPSAADGSSRSLGVSNLAVAPWNRRADGPPARCAGVGTALMVFAVFRSYQLGFGGRIVLEAAAFEPTLKFYDSLGLTQRTKTANGTWVMDLDSDSARSLLTRFRYAF